MTPYYADDAVTIWNADCREMVTALNSELAAVITDPPYGIDWAKSGGELRSGPNGHPEPNRRPRGSIHGDDQPFDPAPWLNFDEVILWGANHYTGKLPVGTTLVWIKRHDPAFGSFLSDAEIAWEKGGHGVYCRRVVGANQTAERLHPFQKPLEIMRWCVERTTAPVILDPFCGSGTTLRAAKDAGRRAIGIEIEERYCEIAAKRCAQEVLSFGAVLGPEAPR